MLYSSFRVILWRLNFVCRRFGTLFHLHRWRILPAYTKKTVVLAALFLDTFKLKRRSGTSSVKIIFPGVFYLLFLCACPSETIFR